MIVRNFSSADLEIHLEELSSDLERVLFLLKEIKRCNDAIQDVKTEALNFNHDHLKINSKTPGNNSSLFEFLKSDISIRRTVSNMIIKYISDYLCNKYTEYLELAEKLLSHITKKLEAASASSTANELKDYSLMDNSMKRIIWWVGREKIFELCQALHKNKMMPEYSVEEILIHFENEKGIPFLKSEKRPEMLRWCGSDSAFSVLVNELAYREVIEEVEKYKIVTLHFINKRGKHFRDLPQKKNYTENCTKTGNRIRDILDEIGIIKKT